MPSSNGTSHEPSIDHAYADRAVCVTGAAGFLGGHLVDALIEHGAHVHAIDDLSSSTLEHLGERIAAHPDRLRVTYGSILEDVALRAAMEGSDLVFHLATAGSHAKSIESPERCFEVNAMGTLRVLQTARREDAARVVTVSCPVVSSRPVTPFLASKRASDLIVESWASTYDIHTLTLRLSQLFGPRQTADSPCTAAIASHMTRALAGLPPLVRRDTHHDHLHVSDAVRALLLAGSAPAAAAGRAIDIASGERIEPHELASRVLRACERTDLTPQPDRDPGVEVVGEMPDLAPARELLGFEPRGPLDQHLRETADWYRRTLGATA